MKIIINSNILWTILNFRKDLIKDLIQNEFEVVCVTSDDEFINSSNSLLQQMNIKFRKVHLQRKGLNPFKDLLYFIELIRVYHQEKPDLILHYTLKPNIYGSIASALLNVPTISTVNGLGSGLINDSFLSKILWIFYKIAFRFPAKVIFQNRDDKELFIGKGIVKSEICEYVPGSGIDPDYYNLPSKLTSSPLKFLFVGRLIKDKGVFEYLKSASLLKKENLDIKFYLAGIVEKSDKYGVSSDQIKKFISEGVIEYLGSTENIMEFFDMVDVVVLPSYREGLSRLLLEAASCRKVIIASDVPGCKEIVYNGGNGFLCKPKDVNSLKDAIIQTVNCTSTELKIMGDNGRELVKNNFSSTIVNGKYIALINEILK